MGQVQERAPTGDPTYSRDALVGDYADARLGQMSITRDDDTLKVIFGAMSGPLTHLGGDGYLAAFTMWGDPPVMFVFRMDEEQGFVLDWGGRIFKHQD